MNLNKIRNMSDYELTKYLNTISNKKPCELCVKCGNETNNKQDRIGIVVYKPEYCKNIKLCNLCHNCYSDLLDYLGVNDV